MESSYVAPDLANLDTADRVGRAAFLWLRQRGICQPVAGPDSGGRHAKLLAAGFIYELCDNLHLTVQQGLLASYTYALLDGSDSNSLEIAAILFDARETPQTAVVFEKGRAMAGEMLKMLENSGYTALPGADVGWRAPRFAC